MTIIITAVNGKSGLVEYIGKAKAYGMTQAQKARNRHKRLSRLWPVVYVDHQLKPVDLRQNLRDIHTRKMRPAFNLNSGGEFWRRLPAGEWYER